MSAEWSEASSSVIHTAEDIIREFYPLLRQARIGFVFREEGQRAGGIYKFGGVQKISDREKVILELDFLIWVGERDWKDASEEMRQAMIDHLLAHCGGFPYAWKVNQPEIREFAVVISRRGLWNRQLLGIDAALNKLIETQGQLLLEGFDRLNQVAEKHGAVVSVSPAAMERVEAEAA